MTTAPDIEATPLSRTDRVGGRVRVALFTNSVAVGGMEEHVRLLVRHLDRARFEVFLIAPRWEPTAGFYRAVAAQTDGYAEITPDRRHGVVRQVWDMARLYRQLRAWRVDVLHMHSTTYRGQALALALARLARVRAVHVTEHLAPAGRVPWPERALRGLFTRAVDGVVCVSDRNHRARARSLYTPPHARVVVNGVDPDDFGPVAPAERAALASRLGLPEGARVVGTVVRLEPEKGLPDLLTAFADVRATAPDAVLLVVGDGSQRADLEAQAARLGLTDSVRFAGFHDDPRPFLALMDVFVLPVPVGSMSIGLLEAMAMRRAVVITFGGAGEAVVDGTSGLCAPPRDPAALAGAITRVLRDPALQAALGEGARRRVEQTFSARRVAAALGELYEGR